MPGTGPGTPLNGTKTKARVNGQVWYHTNWECDPQAPSLPTPSAEDEGFEKDVSGMKVCEVNVEGWFDAGKNMYDAPLNINEGDLLSEVKLYLNDTDSPYWHFPYLRVISVPMRVRVDDKIMYAFRGRSWGRYYKPTGNAV